MWEATVRATERGATKWRAMREATRRATEGRAVGRRREGSRRATVRRAVGRWGPWREAAHWPTHWRARRGREAAAWRRKRPLSPASVACGAGRWVVMGRR